MICAPATARPAFRMGSMGRNGRKRSEDGADDHLVTNDSKPGVCAGKQGRHSLPAAQPHQRLYFTMIARRIENQLPRAGGDCFVQNPPVG
jgi:hypothetical protein